MTAHDEERARQVIEALRARGWMAATAESLTGGLVSAALTAIPGASECIRGGVVAYCFGAKAEMLGVARRVLESRGPADPAVAVQMAKGAARRLHADLAVSTTGAAGPASHGGAEPGTVYVGWWTAQASGAKRWDLSGDRVSIRQQAVGLALSVMVDLAGQPPARLSMST